MSQSKIADMTKAINVFTKTLLWKLTEGHPVEQEEIDALNEIRTEAGMKPLNIAVPSQQPGKKAPEQERKAPEGKAQPAQDVPEFEPQAIVVNGVRVDGQMLPDNAMWTNRFDIRSESSNRLYRIAQNKRKRYWACSCPGWIGHRKCKHLRALGLPMFEEPFEAQLKAASMKTGAMTRIADDIYSDDAHKLAAEFIHNDAELAEMMEGTPVEDVYGEAHIEGPEAGASNDELHTNTHEESGVPVTDGGIKSPERQNVNAIREAIETQAEMEVGKPIEVKQEQVGRAVEQTEAKLNGEAAGATEVSAKPGTQIIINVGSKEAAMQKVAYVSHCPGHKNSKGELAEWCVKSHETGKILSSHGTEAAAKKHLQDMHAHSGSSAGDFTDKPLADPGLTSYRYRGDYGYVMIGAADIADALREAQRSIEGAADIGRLEVWNGTEYQPVDEGQQEPDFDQLLHEEQMDASEIKEGADDIGQGATAETVETEPIGGEHQDKATSGMGTGAFGGTDLEGPSFKTPFHVGFTFRGTQREASFSSFKEAHTFIKNASARFGKVAGNWTMRCPWCKGQATKSKPDDSYSCRCGWNSHTAVDKNGRKKEKKASLEKAAAADPAKRNLVLEILSHGAKTTGEIEKALGGGKYTNISWPILQELAHEKLISHKQMRWSLKASVKTAEWKGWTEDMPVEVVGDKGFETFPNLAAAKAKYPTLDPEHNTHNFTWAMAGRQIDGKPSIRFETWPANKMYSASVKKATFGKTALSIETRISAAGGADVLTEIVNKLNAIHAYLEKKDPRGFMDSFESRLPNFMMDIAQDMNLQMDYTPENDTYMFYDMAGAGTKGKKFEEFEQVQSSLKSAVIRITSVKSMPQKGTPEWAQLQIAVQTMKMPDPMANVMGGPDRAESERILAQYGLKWDEEAYMAGGKGVKKANSEEQVKTADGNLRQQALALAERTVDAYSHDNYQNWAAVCLMLLQRGFTEREAEAILRSKWTRWAGDASDKPYGRHTSKDLARFLDQQKNLKEEVRQLTLETFGASGEPGSEEKEAAKTAGDGMAKTEEQVEKEAGFNFFFPGQVVKEFYPELQHEIVDYPNATNQPMSGAGNPEIVGDNSGEIEGMLDDALDTNVIEMIQLPADVGEVEPLAVAAADYSSTDPAGGMGIGRDGKPEVLEGVPLRKENDIRGYMFTDEFYGQYEGIPGAAMAVASKKAAKGDESKQFALFLKKVCGEIAATLVGAFKITSRPLLDKVPGMGELQLDTIEQGSQAMPLGQTTQGGRVRWLMKELNDSEVKNAINEAWAQAAVWNDNPDGGFVYEVFVRPETIDTESLVLKYKFVCGTRE